MEIIERFIGLIAARQGERIPGGRRDNRLPSDNHPHLTRPGGDAQIIHHKNRRIRDPIPRKNHLPTIDRLPQYSGTTRKDQIVDIVTPPKVHTSRLPAREGRPETNTIYSERR